jgi:hypothetical protein
MVMRASRLGCGLLLLGSLILPHAKGQEAPFPRELVAWEADPSSPVFAGTGGPTWDRKIRERGWILHDGTRYHLFYTGYNEDRSPSRFLGHATSDDGVRWQRDPNNPLTTTGWVEDLCVVKAPGGYWMFAEGERDIAQRLASTDLIHWEPRGPLDLRQTSGEPISAGPRGTPFVLRHEDRWWLFYERRDEGVWLARSDDGEVWTNIQDEPVIACGPGEYDQGAVALNQVIARDGWFYAYYHANRTRPWTEWTTCVARSRDLIHWQKYAGNPILRENKSSAVLVEGPGAVSWLYTMHPAVVRHRNVAEPPPGDGGRE